jgi:hypothetical protein
LFGLEVGPVLVSQSLGLFSGTVFMDFFLQDQVTDEVSSDLRQEEQGVHTSGKTGSILPICLAEFLPNQGVFVSGPKGVPEMRIPEQIGQ